MATNSTVAGYLAPLTSPIYDAAFEDLLQAAIVGITGLPGSLVRPRWQAEPPAQPSFTTDWVAFGIVRRSPDAYAYKAHDPVGLGVDVLERDEELFVLHSFYGPSANAFCERFRDGLAISQNRDALRADGIMLTEVQEAVILPALLKEKWVQRVDVTVQYRRRIQRTYPIQTIVEGRVGLDTEESFTQLIVPPTP